jgi:hypothetical protein
MRTSAARLNAAVTQRRRREEPPAAVSAEPGAYSRFTDPAPSEATRAALRRHSARVKALRVARAQEGRCTECGARGHSAHRCPHQP